MPKSPRAVRLGHLDGLLADLERARQAADEDQEWRLCWAVLELLHSLDDAIGKQSGDQPSYRLARNKDPDGQALAALGWFRNAVHHQGEEMRAFVWRDVSMRTVVDGKEVPMRVGVVVDGKVEYGPVRMSQLAWPLRADVTPSDEPAHGRDVFYDQRVAGRPLMAPLREAQRYLQSLGS